MQSEGAKSNNKNSITRIYKILTFCYLCTNNFINNNLFKYVGYQQMPVLVFTFFLSFFKKFFKSDNRYDSLI